MSTELDIEVYFSRFSRFSVSEIAKYVPVEYQKKNTGSSYHEVIIRAALEPQTVTDVDEQIRDFLRILTIQAEAVKQSHGMLRLGIFYDLSETVVFPFRLSIETIRVLGELNLSVDVTGYPCTEDTDE